MSMRCGLLVRSALPLAALWLLAVAAPHLAPGALPTQLLLFSPMLGRKCGEDATCVARERNAVASWALLAESRLLQLQILALVEQDAYCDPLVVTTLHTTCVGLPQCTHAVTGILTVDCVAKEALALGARLFGAPQFTALLVNSDIMFTQSLIQSLAVTRAALGTQFVLVGRRVDAPVTEMIVARSPPEVMVRDAEAVSAALGAKHSVFGFDYFVFPATAFPPAFPPFLVGRYRWDNVLALELLASGLPFVDATESVVCIHQGYTVNASRPNHIGRLGAQRNAELARMHSGDAHLLGRMDNAEWSIQGACPRCCVVQQQPKNGWLLSAYKAAHLKTRALLLLHAEKLDDARSAESWAAWLDERHFPHFLVLTCTAVVRDALRDHGVPAELLADGLKGCFNQRNDAVSAMLRSRISPIIVFPGVAAAAPTLLRGIDLTTVDQHGADVCIFGGSKKGQADAIRLAPTRAAQKAWRRMAVHMSSGEHVSRAFVVRACEAADAKCHRV